MKLIGLKQKKGEYEGRQFSGKTLYFTFKRQDIQGEASEAVFISDKKLEGVELALDSEYRLNYNRFGKIESIEEIG